MKKSITLFTAILSIFFLLIGCSAKGDEKAAATKRADDKIGSFFAKQQYGACTPVEITV